MSDRLYRKRGSCDVLQLEAARRRASCLRINYDAHISEVGQPIVPGLQLPFSLQTRYICLRAKFHENIFIDYFDNLPAKPLFWTTLGHVPLKLSLLFLIQNVYISRGSACFEILFVLDRFSGLICSYVQILALRKIFTNMWKPSVIPLLLNFACGFPLPM